MSKKSTPGQSYGGLKMQNRPKFLTLFKQLPQAQIGPKFKNCCAHQIANDQTIVLSSENVQKVRSRPKLWAFEKSALFKQLPQAQILIKSKNFCTHQIENCQEIILGIEIFEKGRF